MILGLLRFVCVFVGITGQLLVCLELVVRFERSLLWGGVLLASLALFVTADLWAVPAAGSPQDHVLWMRIQHELSLLICLIAVHFYGIVGGHERRFPNRWFLAWCAIMVFVLLSDAAFRVNNGKFEATALYAGSMLFTIAWATCIIVRFLLGACRKRANRRDVVVHSVAFGALFTTSVADSVVAWRVGLLRLPIPGFLSLGLLIFSLVLTYLFIDQFARIVIDSRVTHSRLRSAYQDLQEALPLSELGQASAMVNHEIGNNVFVMMDNVNTAPQSPQLTAQAQRLLSGLRADMVQLRTSNSDALRRSRPALGAPVARC